MEQLDPDPIGVLDVDLGAFGVLRRHRGLRSFSNQLAVRLPHVCNYERKVVDLFALSIGGIELGARWIPVQLEFLAGAGSHELHVLATVAHRPLVHDLHSDGLRVEGEGSAQIPNANACVIESILHGEVTPRRRYLVATVVRRSARNHVSSIGPSIAPQTASKSQSPAGFAAFAFRWSRWPAFARSCTIHAVYAGDPVAPGEL